MSRQQSTPSAARTTGTTGTTTSRDGTRIAYDRRGSGPAIVVVDGALCSRAFGPSAELAAALADRFTVYTYDRRGRGDSTDAAAGAPYDLQREVDDLAAVVAAAGGSAAAVALSSGGAIALAAAQRGVPLTHLVTYEVPFTVPGSGTPLPPGFADQLRAAVEAGHRGRAVSMFMAQVGTPVAARVVVRLLPVWRKLTAVAHTLPFDISAIARHGTGAPLPAEDFAAARVPTLVVCGSRSPAGMQEANRALADVVPGAAHRVLDGQTHIVKAAALAPVVADSVLR
ncbi:alpha/beta fold hydrolase [Geodermatophilus sp. SYSU D01062]